MGDLITSLAQAIYRFEGSGPSTLATRNNNPGNLRSGPGQIGTDVNGYAIFGSMQDGWNALDNQIQLNIDRGLSLNEFFAGKPGVYPGYAPAEDSNQPYNYASTVGSWIGVDPNVPLNQIGYGTSFIQSSTQPILDLSGQASASTPTADILSSLESSVGLDPAAGLDPASPVSGLVIAAAVAALVWMVMR
jgi:hypothetical protein